MIHLLTYNSSDQKTVTVADYNLGNFELVKFWNQGNSDGLNLQSLKLFLSKGDPADYLPNPISLPIVSTRLKDHISKFKCNVKFIEISNLMEGIKGNCEYFLMEFNETRNVLVSEENFEFNYKYLPNSFPENLDLIRDGLPASGAILISDEFAKSFIGKNFRPVAFIKIKKAEQKEYLDW